MIKVVNQACHALLKYRTTWNHVARWIRVNLNSNRTDFFVLALVTCDMYRPILYFAGSDSTLMTWPDFLYYPGYYWPIWHPASLVCCGLWSITSLNILYPRLLLLLMKYALTTEKNPIFWFVRSFKNKDDKKPWHAVFLRQHAPRTCQQHRGGCSCPKNKSITACKVCRFCPFFW